VNRTVRRAFDQAADTLLAAFEKAGPFPGQEVTPALLADAVRQCFEICRQVDESGETLPLEEVDELGNHALECLSDLGLWAYQLDRDEARAAVEDIALELALWVIGHGGQLAVLEPVVNALARQANAARDPAILAGLFRQACAVIAHADPGLATDTGPELLQPWLMLHFNCAIIATRTQDPARMNAAFDLLETHLPGHCAAFYAEGVRESQKAGYSDATRDAMRIRLAKWTGRH
jgi:hypothetical protein